MKSISFILLPSLLVLCSCNRIVPALPNQFPSQTNNFTCENNSEYSVCYSYKKIQIALDERRNAVKNDYDEMTIGYMKKPEVKIDFISREDAEKSKRECEEDPIYKEWCMNNIQIVFSELKESLLGMEDYKASNQSNGEYFFREINSRGFLVRNVTDIGDLGLFREYATFLNDTMLVIRLYLVAPSEADWADDQMKHFYIKTIDL